MVNRKDIKEHMRLVTKDGAAFIVDRIDDNGIKLTRDDKGVHHYIPLDWVEKVEQDTAKLSKSAQEVKQQWRPESGRSGGPV